MENKKTKIAIVIVILLIILLIAVSYFYNGFNTEQVQLLTNEANKILESNLVDYDMEFNIKTEKNYAEVEQAVKEYIYKLKNIYEEMEEIVSSINPNIIFSAENVPNKKLDGIEKIINDYKEKSQELIEEYETLIMEEKIIQSINDAKISTRKDYYINIYKEIMLSETMQEKYIELDEQIKNEKGRLYEKLNKVEKMRKFLEEHEDNWEIKDGKIHFTNINRMTEYYALFNQVID